MIKIKAKEWMYECRYFYEDREVSGKLIYNLKIHLQPLC